MTVYLVLLRFSMNRARAKELMASHNEWIARGLAEGFFLIVGALPPGLGGALVASGLGRQALDARLAEDPFVANDVVTVEVVEVSPVKTDPRLSFLLP